MSDVFYPLLSQTAISFQWALHGPLQEFRARTYELSSTCGTVTSASLSCVRIWLMTWCQQSLGQVHSIARDAAFFAGLNSTNHWSESLRTFSWAWGCQSIGSTRRYRLFPTLEVEHIWECQTPRCLLCQQVSSLSCRFIGPNDQITNRLSVVPT